MNLERALLPCYHCGKDATFGTHLACSIKAQCELEDLTNDFKKWLNAVTEKNKEAEREKMSSARCIDCGKSWPSDCDCRIQPRCMRCGEYGHLYGSESLCKYCWHTEFDEKTKALKIASKEAERQKLIDDITEAVIDKLCAKSQALTMVLKKKDSASAQYAGFI